MGRVVSLNRVGNCKYAQNIIPYLVIGASLSEPHTGVTALRTCVCMSVCLSVCGHIPKILNERAFKLRRWVPYEDRARCAVKPEG